MKCPINPISLAFVSVVAISPTASAWAAEEPGIPTQLINDPTTGDLNGPCSVCRVHSIRVAEQNTTAELELDYADDGQDLSGYIELTILLYAGTFETMVVESVTLLDGVSVVLLLPPGDGWSWEEDVRHVWVQPRPGIPGN